MTVQEALEFADRHVPKGIPEDLRNACKCEPIDPDWPIGGPLDALRVLMAWEHYDNQPKHTIGEIAYRITHSHHFEYEDLQRYGVAEVYQKSLATKYVSIGWFLAGRYNQDNFLVEEFTRLGWPNFKLLDFGAAPWIQSIFYAKKGFDVTAVNQSRSSDCHRFGMFLAEANGLTRQHVGEPLETVWTKAFSNGKIRSYASDESWHEQTYDVIYAVDVLEHIPPNPDGSLGWIPLAERMLNALKPGGMCYISAPFEKADGVARPVETHPVHYTSPISIEDWLRAEGMIYKGWWEKP